MTKKVLLMAVLCLYACTAFAQFSVVGKVENEVNGKPIVGISVSLDQTSIGTFTDVNGFFELKNIPDGKYVLRVSGMNYKTVKTLVYKQTKELLLKTEDTFINLDQVVVTGTGTQHRLKKSPVAVEVFTANDIAKLGKTDFVHALRSMNASLNFSSSALGASMTLNGLRNRHVLVLVDGQKVNGDRGGDLDLERLDLSNVQRVEVLKGGASSLYGSEAIGGVIQIITSNPKKPISTSYYTRFSKYGQLQHNTNLDINVGKFSSKTSFSRGESNGWKLSDKELKNNRKTKTIDTIYGTDKLASGQFISNIVNQRITYQFTKSLNIYAAANYYEKNNPRPVTAYDYGMSYCDYGFAIGGKYILKNDAYIDFDFQNDNYHYSKVYNKNVFNKKNEILNKLNDKLLSKKQKYYRANIKSVFNVNSSNRVTVGTEYSTDVLINPDVLTEDKKVFTSALYAQDELQVGSKLQFVAGARYVYHETFKSSFTPKVAVKYSPAEWLNLRATYAAGFRSPDLMELFYNKEMTSGGQTTLSLGNINLKPEKSNYFSLNAEYIGKHFTLSATAYTNRINNLISRVEQPLTAEDEANKISKRLEYLNTDRAMVNGVDLSLNAVVGNGLSFSGTYSFSDVKDLATNLPLSKSIRHSATAMVNWEKLWTNYRLNINLNGQFSGERYESSRYGNAPAYQLWNIATRHIFLSLQKNISIEPGFGIDNIFDYRDTRPMLSNYSTLSPGRTFYVSLLIKFSK